MLSSNFSAFAKPYCQIRLNNSSQSVVRFGLLLLSMLFLCHRSISQQSDCTVLPVSASTDLPSVVQPFCNASGFNVAANLEILECNIIDVFVILKARPKFDGTLFDPTIFSDADRYFSNIGYASGIGTPSLSEEFAFGGYDNGIYKVFRFRISVPYTGNPQSVSFNFPFAFESNWFFGDCPWKIYMYATAPYSNGEPSIPTNWNEITPNNSPISTLLFDAPYFPIVGSSNLSSHYNDLTGFSNGIAHAIILLPDNSGAFPVLTIDVPSLIVGSNSLINRGKLYLSPGSQIRITDGNQITANIVDMFTCSNVSKGITIENGGTLVLNRTQFDDAEVAIDAKRGSRVKCNIGSFAGNYRAMRLDNSGMAGADLEMEFTGSNTFLGGDPKPGYPGMSSNIDKGYGLEILYHPFISLLQGVFADLNLA